MVTKEIVKSPYMLEEVIRFSDCDPAGICYFGRFSTFFDESYISLAREHGLGWDEHETYNFLLPIVETQTQFSAPLKAGDIARIYTALTRIGNRSFTSNHLITVKEGENERLVATGYISRVTVDYHTFKPRPIPTELLGVLESHFMEKDAWETFSNIYSDK